jgi:hypothetical protein
MHLPRFIHAVSLLGVVVVRGALPVAAFAQAIAPAASPATAAATGVPSLAPIAPRQVQIGDSLRIPVVVNDLPIGATVELRLDGQPASAKVEQGAIRWRPLRADANASYNIGVHALVGRIEVARGSVEISVVNAHRPPVIRQPADRILPPGDSLSFQVEATDPDGDPLSVAVSNLSDLSLPPRYDRQTGILTWQAPRGNANRLYLWRITVSDGDGGSATADMHVSVRSQNVAPVCAPLRTYKRDEGEQVAIALEAEDANGDSLTYAPLASLPNGVLSGATYRWSIPYNFVLPTRQDSTVRFEWRASDPSQATTAGNCFALVTVFRSIADEPFRMKQQLHRQLIADVRSELTNYEVRERATRDSLSASSRKKTAVKRASLLSALVGGLLQIAKSEDTRRIAAGVSATLTVGLTGWEATIEDGGPLSNRAEAIAQQRVSLQRALSRFLRKYGETVSRESLLGSNYEADHLELFDLLAASGRIGTRS